MLPQIDGGYDSSSGSSSESGSVSSSTDSESESPSTSDTSSDHRKTKRTTRQTVSNSKALGQRTLRSRVKQPKLEQKKELHKCPGCKKPFQSKSSVNRHLRFCKSKKTLQEGSKAKRTAASSRPKKLERPRKALPAKRNKRLVKASESTQKKLKSNEEPIKRSEVNAAPTTKERESASSSTTSDNECESQLVIHEETMDKEVTHAEETSASHEVKVSMEENPVKCNNCLMTYRTAASYEKHLSTCVPYESSSTEEDTDNGGIMDTAEEPEQATSSTTTMQAEGESPQQPPINTLSCDQNTDQGVGEPAIEYNEEIKHDTEETLEEDHVEKQSSLPGNAPAHTATIDETEETVEGKSVEMMDSDDYVTEAASTTQESEVDNHSLTEATDTTCVDVISNSSEDDLIETSLSHPDIPQSPSRHFKSQDTHLTQESPKSSGNSFQHLPVPFSEQKFSTKVPVTPSTSNISTFEQTATREQTSDGQHQASLENKDNQVSLQQITKSPQTHCDPAPNSAPPTSSGAIFHQHQGMASPNSIARRQQQTSLPHKTTFVVQSTQSPLQQHSLTLTPSQQDAQSQQFLREFVHIQQHHLGITPQNNAQSPLDSNALQSEPTASQPPENAAIPTISQLGSVPIPPISQQQPQPDVTVSQHNVQASQQFLQSAAQYQTFTIQDSNGQLVTIQVPIVNSQPIQFPAQLQAQQQFQIPNAVQQLQTQLQQQQLALHQHTQQQQPHLALQQQQHQLALQHQHSQQQTQLDLQTQQQILLHQQSHQQQLAVHQHTLQPQVSLQQQASQQSLTLQQQVQPHPQLALQQQQQTQRQLQQQPTQLATQPQTHEHQHLVQLQQHLPVHQQQVQLQQQTQLPVQHHHTHQQHQLAVQQQTPQQHQLALQHHQQQQLALSLQQQTQQQQAQQQHLALSLQQQTQQQQQQQQLALQLQGQGQPQQLVLHRHGHPPQQLAIQLPVQQQQQQQFALHRPMQPQQQFTTQQPQQQQQLSTHQQHYTVHQQSQPQFALQHQPQQNIAIQPQQQNQRQQITLQQPQPQHEFEVLQSHQQFSGISPFRPEIVQQLNSGLLPQQFQIQPQQSSTTQEQVLNADQTQNSPVPPGQQIMTDGTNYYFVQQGSTLSSLPINGPQQLSPQTAHIQNPPHLNPHQQQTHTAPTQIQQYGNSVISYSPTHYGQLGHSPELLQCTAMNTSESEKNSNLHQPGVFHSSGVNPTATAQPCPCPRCLTRANGIVPDEKTIQTKFPQKFGTKLWASPLIKKATTKNSKISMDKKHIKPLGINFPKLLPATVVTVSSGTNPSSTVTSLMSSSSDSILCQALGKAPVSSPNVAVVRPMEHPLQKLSEQVSQMETSFNSITLPPSLPFNTQVQIQITPAQMSPALQSISVEAANAAEISDPHSVENIFDGAPGGPPAPSIESPVRNKPSGTKRKSGDAVSSNASSSDARKIIVRLKRKERGDSYSIKNVSGSDSTCMQGTMMKSLKIKAKITSGEQAGTLTDVEVLPRVHTVPIPDPDCDSESNLTIAEDDLPSTSNTTTVSSECSSQAGRNMTHRAVIIVYEVRCQEAVLYRSSDVRAVWSHIFETVQGSRLNHNLPPLSYPTTNISLPDKQGESIGFNMSGLTHRALQFLLEQLTEVKSADCQFRFHEPPGVGEDCSIPLNEANETGCARTEVYSGRKPFDMFSWLACKHRKLPSLIENPDKSGKGQGLTVEMRYRALKKLPWNATLAVYYSAINGRGLYTRRDFEKGDMIIEYSGEIIRSLVCDERAKLYESKGMGCYMFRIEDELIVDATMKGDASRFINHSCEPNCESKSMKIWGNMHIIIFALRRINRGEELTYDYKFNYEEDKIPCTLPMRIHAGGVSPTLPMLT